MTFPLLIISKWVLRLALCGAASCGMLLGKDEVYQDPQKFITESFDEEVPRPSLLWLIDPLKGEVAKILGHPYPAIRIRYWQKDRRTAWILEEIGKTKPITTGIVIDGGKIVRLKVLVYRESHGWEVKYPFFTDQFNQAELDSKGSLSQPIDGISGATLSVKALERLARLALRLDRAVHEDG